MRSLPALPAAERRGSICVLGQEEISGDQGEFERSMALRMVRSLCMQATMATIGSVPAAMRRAWKAAMTGLCLMAESVPM